MNPATLSEHAASLHQELSERFPVEFSPVTIRGRELTLLQVSDLEPLLAGKDPFQDVSSFPFWVKLWEGALVLADVVATLPVTPGQRLLELGAGMGLPGLTAAACGFATTLSDYQQHILDFQRVSAAASQLADQVDHQLIDWLAPPELPRFDRIIGAEILFREEFFAPLLSVFRTYLKPDGEIYLAHDVRRKSLPPFLLQAEKEYQVAVSTRRLRTDDEEFTIIVNRLRPRANV